MVIKNLGVSENGKRMEFSNLFNFSVYVGTAYLVLTDNESYAISVAEFRDGSRHFFVMSKITNLTKKSLRDIKRKYEELGFNTDSYLEMDYNECDDPYWA
jgi:hypothetical protein